MGRLEQLYEMLVDVGSRVLPSRVIRHHDPAPDHVVIPPIMSQRTKAEVPSTGYHALSKWDKRFLRLAEEISTWSKDPSAKVGCVLISPDRRSVSYGFNGFPRGIADDIRISDRETKLEMTVHAEVNAILNSDTRPHGWTLYCTRPPCMGCAAAIIQSGIESVYCLSVPATSRWYDELVRARRFLDEACVVTTWVRK